MEQIIQSYTYTTTYNPRCKSICERMHVTMNEHLRCVGLDDWHLKLPAVAWFMRTNYHNAIGTSPGALVFGRGMILENQVEINLYVSERRKRQLKDLKRDNRVRI